MDRKMARRISRFIHFAMGAGKEAVAVAGSTSRRWTPDQRDRVGGRRQHRRRRHGAGHRRRDVHARRAPVRSSAFAIPALSGSMAAAHVSMEYGLTGPVITQVAACATSVIAFQDALRLIRVGRVRRRARGRLRGAAPADGLRGARQHGRAIETQRLTRAASRPFDKTRDGFVFGEGAGVVVVESRGARAAPGATTIAEILGGALTADAFHICAPEPTGRGQARAMTNALRNAGVAPDEID